MEFPIRINKYLRDRGFASRREADELIISGKVQVNGKRAKLGLLINERDKVILSGNALVSSNVPFWVENRSYGALFANYEGLNPLLRCLIGKESSWNELAYNPKDIDGLPKFGLLQFEERTFQEWCAGKYGLKNDIWSGQVQVQCFNLMVADGQLWRWPPAKKCL